MPLDPTISLAAGNALTQNAPKSFMQDPSQLNALVGAASGLQGLQAKQAIGQAYQQATDPTTGQLDVNKLTGILSQNPKAAFGMSDATTAALAQARQQLDNQGITADVYRKRMDVLGDAFSPLLGKVDANGNPTIKKGDVLDAAALLLNMPESQRPVNTAQVVQFYNSLPDDNTPGAAAHIYGKIKQLEIQRASADAVFQHLYPTPNLVNQGPNIKGVTSSGFGGVQPAGGNASNIPLGLSPGENANPTPLGVLPGSNVPVSGTRQQFLDRAQGGAAPNIGTGRYQPTAPAAAPAPGASNSVPGGGIAMGPPPGQIEAQTGVAKASGDSLSADLAASKNFPTRILPLQEALSSLDQLGRTGTGPGTAERNNIVSFLQSLPGGIGQVFPGVDEKDIGAFDKANKYLTAYAQQSAANLGHGTDQQLATALSGNASTHISNLAAKDVVKTQLGLERMRQAMLSDFQNTKGPDGGPLPASQYTDFASKWAGGVDPKAFAIDLASDPSKIIASLKTPEQKAKFAASLRKAIKAGVITPPDQGQASAP